MYFLKLVSLKFFKNWMLIRKRKQKTYLDVQIKTPSYYTSWVTIWTFWNKMISSFCLMYENNFYFELKVCNSLGFHFLLKKTIILNRLGCFREQHWRPWWSASVRCVQLNHLQYESYSSKACLEGAELRYIISGFLKFFLGFFWTTYAFEL